MNNNEGKRPDFTSVNTLTRLQVGRYHAAYPRFKDKTLAYLSYLSDRGQNSYEVVSAKADEINERRGNDRNYDRALIAAFTQGVNVESTDVCSRICDIRSKFGYGRLKGNIAKQAIDELKRVFIVHEPMVENVGNSRLKGKCHKVYKPVFSLLAE